MKFLATLLVISCCLIANSYQLYLTDGRMAKGACKGLKNTTDVCALEAKLNETLAKFSKQDQQTFLKTKQFMDTTIDKYRQIGMISLIQMNKALLDQFRKIEPVNSERLLNLFGFSVGQDGMLTKSDSRPAKSDLCSSFKQYLDIQNSLSSEGKSILDDISCGLQKTIKKELTNDPRMLAGVFNREFIDLVMRKKDDLKPFARYLKDLF